MARLSFFMLLTSKIISRVLTSPAPLIEPEHNALERREFQANQTAVAVTRIVTATRISTLTTCPTGSEWPSTTNPTGRPAATSISEPTFDGCHYIVPEAGKFKNKKEFTFIQPGLPNGLYASTYMVYDTANGLSYNHKFETSNVYSDGEFLNLKVQGTTEPDSLPERAISSAEIVTTENNILYASVRTKAVFSDVPGTCHGKQTSSPKSFQINVDRNLLLPG